MTNCNKENAEEMGKICKSFKNFIMDKTDEPNDMYNQADAKLNDENLEKWRIWNASHGIYESGYVRGDKPTLTHEEIIANYNEIITNALRRVIDPVRDAEGLAVCCAPTIDNAHTTLVKAVNSREFTYARVTHARVTHANANYAPVIDSIRAALVKAVNAKEFTPACVTHANANYAPAIDGIHAALVKSVNAKEFTPRACYQL